MALNGLYCADVPLSNYSLTRVSNLQVLVCFPSCRSGLYLSQLVQKLATEIGALFLTVFCFIYRTFRQGCGFGLDASVSRQAVSRRSSASARSRLGVGTPRPRLGLELWRSWSRSRSRLGLNCQRLGLGLGLQCLGLASVSTKKASCTSLPLGLAKPVTGATA